MARQTKASSEKSWFHPLYPVDGEARRDKPDDPKPFRVEVEPISGAEMAKLEAKHLDPREKSSLIHRGQTLEEQLFARRVGAVENYSAEFDGKTYNPKTGAELYVALKAGPASEWDVIGSDIIGAIRDGSKLRGDLPPSSASPSASG